MTELSDFDTDQKQSYMKKLLSPIGLCMENYYHYLVHDNIDEKSLIRPLYYTQMFACTKNDWMNPTLYVKSIYPNPNLTIDRSKSIGIIINNLGDYSEIKDDLIDLVSHSINLEIL